MVQTGGVILNLLSMHSKYYAVDFLSNGAMCVCYNSFKLTSLNMSSRVEIFYFIEIISPLN
jgi:hypothetical protein